MCGIIRVLCPIPPENWGLSTNINIHLSQSLVFVFLDLWERTVVSTETHTHRENMPGHTVSQHVSNVLARTSITTWSFHKTENFLSVSSSFLMKNVLLTWGLSVTSSRSRKCIFYKLKNLQSMQWPDIVGRIKSTGTRVNRCGPLLCPPSTVILTRLSTLGLHMFNECFSAQ